MPVDTPIPAPIQPQHDLPDQTTLPPAFHDNTPSVLDGHDHTNPARRATAKTPLDEVHSTRDDFRNDPRGYAEMVNGMTSTPTDAESFLPPASRLLCDVAPLPADMPPQASGPSGADAKELAERAYAAMNQQYGNYPHHEWAPLVPGFTTAWPLGQQIQAVLDADKLGDSHLNVPHELDQRLDALHYYWENKNGIGGYDASMNGLYNNHDRFYDDNAWIGLDLMDVYQRDNKQGWALDQAKKVFDLEEHGADEASKVATEPGGVMWKEGDKKGFRGTVSTAGATQVALRLYEATHDDKYLNFAEKQFDWVDKHLSDGNGEYIDGIDGDGTKHKEIYTYNQGLMLGDAVKLYEATGDSKYKDKAEQIIDASTKHFSEQELEKQQPIFNAIYFKNLMEADAALNAPPEVQQQHRAMIEQYADYLRNHMDKNGVVKTGLEQDDSWRSLTQSASVQIFSMLA